MSPAISGGTPSSRPSIGQILRIRRVRFFAFFFGAFLVDISVRLCVIGEQSGNDAGQRKFFVLQAGRTGQRASSLIRRP